MSNQRISAANRNGLNAPPQRAASHSQPPARPRAAGDSQADCTRAMFGNAPASPAPNRNRIAKSDANPAANPVSAVNSDQAKHDAGQCQPGAEAVAEPTGRNLEDRIGEPESRRRRGPFGRR